MPTEESLKGGDVIQPLGESYILTLLPGDEIAIAINGETKKKFLAGNYVQVRVYINTTTKR